MEYVFRVEMRDGRHDPGQCGDAGRRKSRKWGRREESVVGGGQNETNSGRSDKGFRPKDVGVAQSAKNISFREVRQTIGSSVIPTHHDRSSFTPREAKRSGHLFIVEKTVMTLSFVLISGMNRFRKDSVWDSCFAWCRAVMDCII